MDSRKKYKMSLQVLKSQGTTDPKIPVGKSELYAVDNKTL